MSFRFGQSVTERHGGKTLELEIELRLGARLRGENDAGDIARAEDLLQPTAAHARLTEKVILHPIAEFTGASPSSLVVRSKGRHAPPIVFPLRVGGDPRECTLEFARPLALAIGGEARKVGGRRITDLRRDLPDLCSNIGRYPWVVAQSQRDGGLRNPGEAGEFSLSGTRRRHGWVVICITIISLPTPLQRA